MRKLQQISVKITLKKLCIMLKLSHIYSLKFIFFAIMSAKSPVLLL